MPTLLTPFTGMPGLDVQSVEMLKVFVIGLGLVVLAKMQVAVTFLQHLERIADVGIDPS